jgi:hypothetical protein
MHNMIIGVEVPIRVNGVMRATEMGTEDGQKMMDVGEGGVMSKGVVVADGRTKVVMNVMTRAAGGRGKTMKAGVMMMMMMMPLLLNRTEHLPKAVGWAGEKKLENWAQR